MRNPRAPTAPRLDREFSLLRENLIVSDPISEAWILHLAQTTLGQEINSDCRWAAIMVEIPALNDSERALTFRLGMEAH